VERKLEDYQTFGYKNIHFTDEDLFLDIDRANLILNICRQLGGFNLIALTHSFTILKFIKKYGLEMIRESGIKLLEIGYEGALLSIEKGVGCEADCIELHNICGDLAYFLTMTFGPGETIKTLNKTGQFLKQYGKKPEEMVPRLRTNGTEGGLGQFFQPYPDLQQELSGQFSPFNCTRLYPSFIPSSFLNSKIEKVNLSRYNELKEWCNLYGIRVPSEKWLFALKGCKVRRHIGYINEWDWITKAERAIELAIAARLGIIK